MLQLNLSGWLSACQFSIFELVYKRGKEVLPFVREIAWGEYDWTQGNAIEPLLPELANDEKLKQVFDELFSIEEFKEAFAELTAAEV